MRVWVYPCNGDHSVAITEAFYCRDEVVTSFDEQAGQAPIESSDADATAVLSPFPGQPLTQGWHLSHLQSDVDVRPVRRGIFHGIAQRYNEVWDQFRRFILFIKMWIRGQSMNIAQLFKSLAKIFKVNKKKGSSSSSR